MTPATASGQRIRPSDEVHLRRALELARRGRGAVHPNPMVGCVLTRDDEVVGEGWHRRYGGPHAEVWALEEAGERSRGATAWVSLEPCAHHGKTPPCVEALRDAGVARVVFGAPDPGSWSGGGAEVLRQAGVEVVGPVWSEAEGRALNPAFYHLARNEGPYLALKLAVSLDGRIAGAPGRRSAITGPVASREVHRLRSEHRAVLVGGETVRVDDPLLTVRNVQEPPRPPTRVVLDTDCRIRRSAALFGNPDRAPVLVFCGADAPRSRTGPLRAAGAEVERVPRGPAGLDLPAVASSLRRRGLLSVLCEGGGRLGSALLEAGLVHRLLLFVAPRVLGPEGVPAFPGPFGPEAWEGWRAVGPHRSFGPDVLVTWEREGDG